MRQEYSYFRPEKMASWVTVLDDILWPDSNITDRIKRRADGFAQAGIDTAINFGFHTRFDFSDYFEQLHGYFNAVCEELHKYGIRFMDHYTCNLIERPRTEEDRYLLHNSNRHHVLLPKDSRAAVFAQYEGHLFQNLCEKRVEDGLRGYTPAYQAELFCHNDPEFLEMHRSYLKRLQNDVPIDGFQVDDMCDYGMFSTCCCPHCLDRFRREFGRELPPISDTSFWGDTSQPPITWGNYDNPAFRDWVQLKINSVHDHIAVVKEAIGDKPLMTCCSATGRIYLNALGLDLERVTDNLDLVMLENCGMSVGIVNWVPAEAEALLQKNIAYEMGHAPAVALSYSTYAPSAYLGWSLARFWGATNWASTLVGRLNRDPGDIPEIYELLAPCNNWEDRNSRLDLKTGVDLAEVRLVNNLFCRESGFLDADGYEHWDKVHAWSQSFVEANVGYRFLRFEELADAARLCAETTPIVLDGCGCVSDAQFAAISAYLEQGGAMILALPFGVCDEHGNARSTPLSDVLLAKSYPGLTLVSGLADVSAVRKLIQDGKITPRIRQTAGEETWALRLRTHGDRLVLHVLNRALEAIPHETLLGAMESGQILKDFKSTATGDPVTCEIDLTGLDCTWHAPVLKSPELGQLTRAVTITNLDNGVLKLSFDPKNIQLYAVIDEQI
mgnify:CR=1 FL=1